MHYAEHEQGSDWFQRVGRSWPIWTTDTSRGSGTVHRTSCFPLDCDRACVLGQSNWRCFGSAVLDAIINNKLTPILDPNISAAAIKAGLPSSSVPALLKAMATGAGLDDVPRINPAILAATSNASEWAYAHAYRLAWASIVPFVVLALVAVVCLKDVKELMTEKVEATVEQVEQREKVAI